MLNDDNFLLYAMHSYDKVSVVSISEFENDLIRFKYLKKLFNRYSENLDLNEKLILNHIIILYNVFGDNTTNMLFYKIPHNQWGILSTFLLFLNRLPETVPDKLINTTDILIDKTIANKLRMI